MFAAHNSKRSASAKKARQHHERDKVWYFAIFVEVKQFIYSEWSLLISLPNSSIMSGIEIAGLVLGVLPLLLKALDASRGGLKAAFRKSKYLEKLSQALIFHRQSLEETVRSVILASGYKNSLVFDEDPFECLRDQDVKEQIIDFLGPKAEAASTGILEESRNIVKTIASHIEGLMPPPTVSIYAPSISQLTYR